MDAEIFHQVKNKHVSSARMSQQRNRLQKVVNWHSLAQLRTLCSWVIKQKPSNLRRYDRLFPSLFISLIANE
jgi:hypothetical protein